jgi:hypothetical protein
MADGRVDGDNLICGVHQWDYRLDTGVGAYNNAGALHRFTSWVEDGGVFNDRAELDAFAIEHPQPFQRDEYLGVYQDTHGDPAEPHNKHIQRLAKEGGQVTQRG